MAEAISGERLDHFEEGFHLPEDVGDRDGVTPGTLHSQLGRKYKRDEICKLIFSKLIL